ncbi:MAG: hypothetical protein A3G87_00605 [Omnitrophica bacterium RIFCSPLOWO2_12_FULL_50_11]|nr:MAG: hypothetical protein A3G87_00605 [Omnitrophica bacterium RIFCSPLOWO2_12_FULL_50_11]
MVAKSRKKEDGSKVGIRLEKRPKILRQYERGRPIRKHVRALFCLMSEYIKRKNVFVFSDNISTGGVFLETFDPLPPGTKVTLRFPLKSALRPIQIRGKVVWNRGEIQERRLGNKAAGMAVEFQSLKRRDMKFLKEFLDHTMSYGWFLE